MRLDFRSDINKGYETAMNYPQADKLVLKVHWWSFIILSILVFFNSVLKISDFYQSPFSWRVISIPEALVVMAIGFTATLIPTFLKGKLANHYIWRVFVTSTLAVYSYLFVFISGGSIEMHFTFFIIIALVAIYSDWRLGWIMFVLIILHHGILNHIAPNWLYFYGRNDFSIIAHALPVLVIVIFTTWICRNTRDAVLLVIEAKRELTEKGKEQISSLEGENTAVEFERNKLSLILDNVAEGIVAVDTNMRFTIFNKSAEVILGIGLSKSNPEA